jgi:hypothetical protein
MREFEKWWEMVNIPHVPTREDSATAAEAWQAALKWAKAMHDVSSEPKFSVMIQEELKG